MLAATLAWAGIGCHSILGPTPVEVDTNWKVFNSAQFAFHVRPGPYAEQRIDTLTLVLEDQYAFALAALDIRYAGRISLFLYASDADADDESERPAPATPTPKPPAAPSSVRRSRRRSVCWRTNRITSSSRTASGRRPPAS